MPIVIVILFVVGAVRRQLARLSAPAAAERTKAPPPIVPQPAPPRRRLSPAPASRPVTQPFAPPARVTVAPSMAETLPAEAAAAFPGLDLLLPGSGDLAATSPRRRIRAFGGGAAIGSPRWGANAVLALEILGPPVSLRSGATLGVPHAF